MLRRGLLAFALALPVLPAEAQPWAPEAGCLATYDAAGALVCAFGALPADPACPALDLDGLGRKLAHTHAVGLFTKLQLKLELEGLIGEARTLRGAPSPEGALALRGRFEALHGRALSKLRSGGDEPLAAEIGCNREPLWSALITP